MGLFSRKKRKRELKLFDVKIRTKKQKKFFKWFIVLKAVIYTIIFILVILFLYKLRSIGK